MYAYRFWKLSAISYALKAAIETDLERILKAGILETIFNSEWTSPIVAVTNLMDQSLYVPMSRSQ